MPSKNIIKTYYKGAYFHVYNRGVEKRSIFIDEQDCQVFLRYIKLYLSPLEFVNKMGESEPKIRRFFKLNLKNDVELLCFALMPNHFHMLLKNKSERGIPILMQRVMTAYTMYFNKKYNRIGALFQNAYKASPVLHDSYLLHLTRYIHNNSSRIQPKQINFMNYSSYPYYLGTLASEWLNTTFILDYFKNTIKATNTIEAYKSFVEMDITDSISVLNLNNLILENDLCI